MIREIHVENFKSVEKLTLELGRINVFIGENGCGKSNVLEAIAFASAAARNKLDNEFLASRGIRVTEPRFMRSAFREEQAKQNVQLALSAGKGTPRFECSLQSDETQTYSRWVNADLETTLQEAILKVLYERDKQLAEGALFDQRSANEGFLFLLFYFTLFISPDTPSFFAVDNVDASLNPRLCARLITELSGLAEEHGKQAILTTHNPAVLDGLDLHDDEQRLFVIHRASRGPTKARRVLAPEPIEGRSPMKLSEAFLGGHIGGLPKNF